MYNVFYAQRLLDHTTIRATVSFETKDEALSRYYTELAQIGISTNLYWISAMVFTDEGDILKQTIERKSSVEPVETE